MESLSGGTVIRRREKTYNDLRVPCLGLSVIVELSRADG